LRADHLDLPSKQGFLNRKPTARAPNQLLCGGIRQKLEAEAESIFLPRHSQNLHCPEGEREFQPNHLTQRRFVEQQGGDARFADVHRVTPDRVPISGIDFDLYIQLVARMTSVFDKAGIWITGSMLGSHFATSYPWNYPVQMRPSNKKSADSHVIGNLLTLLYTRESGN